MVLEKHKLLTNLMGFIASEKGFSVELESDTVTGVKPDGRFTHKDYYPVHLETQTKGGGHQIKLEKTNKAHAVLLFIDGSKYDFDTISLNSLMNQLKFQFSKCIEEAEAPVGQLIFTKFWPWLKTMQIGEIFHTPRRNKKYHFYHQCIGHLMGVQILINGSHQIKGLCRINDCWKEKIEGLQNRYDGKVWVEYSESVHKYEKDKEKDKITIVEYEIEELE